MTALPDWDVASDAELVHAAVAGDREAFAEIYDRYSNRLHDFCVGMVRNRDVAADCVQDVFCIAASRLSQLNNPDSLRPWLYSIAHRQALKSINRSGRERVVEDVPDEPSADAGPDALAARHELADLIAQAAGGLSDRDLAVLDLSYRHGLDGSELAKALGVSTDSAKKMTQRLRDTVERSLGALLVSRSVIARSEGCAELRAILDGWDGRLTVLLRKRIARHIESCPVCDDERRRLVNPVALLGGTPVFVAAPDGLRARTLDAVQLPATVTGNVAAHERGSSHRMLLRAGVIAAAVIAVLGVFAMWRYERHPAVAPSNVTRNAPDTSGASPTSAARQPRVAPPETSVSAPSVQSPTYAVTPISAPPSEAPPPVAGPVTTSTPPTLSTRPHPPAPPPRPVAPSPPVITAEPVPVIPPAISATPIQPSTPIKVRPPVIPTKAVPVTTMPPVTMPPVIQ